VFKIIFHEICQQEKHLERENLHSADLILLKIFELLDLLDVHPNRKEKNKMKMNFFLDNFEV
jgi:hypothetical protein